MYGAPADRYIPPSLLVPHRAILPKNFTAGSMSGEQSRGSLDIPESSSEEEEEREDDVAGYNSPNALSSGDEADASFGDLRPSFADVSEF